jgi:hypothetical protein
MDWEKRSFFPNAVLPAALNQFLAQLAYRSQVYFTQPLHPIFAIVHHPQACLEHVAGVHGSLYGLDFGAGDTDNKRLHPVNKRRSRKCNKYPSPPIRLFLEHSCGFGS